MEQWLCGGRVWIECTRDHHEYRYQQRALTNSAAMGEPLQQDIVIRTSAELAGAEAAAASLEKNIGRAKALGHEYGQMEKQLAQAKQAISDYQNNQPKDNPAEKIKVGHHELKMATKILKHELGEFGHFAHYVFNPWLLGFAAMTFATEKLREWNKKLNESLIQLHEDAIEVGSRRMRAYADATAKVRSEQRELSNQLRQTQDAQNLERLTRESEERKTLAEHIRSQRAALAELQFQQGKITKEELAAKTYAADEEKAKTEEEEAQRQANAKIDAEAAKAKYASDRLMNMPSQLDAEARATSKAQELTAAEEAKKKAEKDLAAARQDVTNSPEFHRISGERPAIDDEMYEENKELAMKEIENRHRLAEENEKRLVREKEAAEATAKLVGILNAELSTHAAAAKALDEAETARRANAEKQRAADASTRAAKYLADAIKGGGVAGEVADAAVARDIEIHQQNRRRHGLPGEVQDASTGQWRAARKGESPTGLTGQQTADENALRGQLDQFTPALQKEVLAALHMARENNKRFSQQILDALAMSANNHEQQAKIVQELTRKLQSTNAQLQSWQ